MPRPVAASLLLAALAAPALAAPATAETLLRLTQQAQIAVHPDVLAATLRVEADAATAAEAQARVNAQATRALAEARAAAGIVAETGSYNVWHQTQPTPRWHAVQSIALHSPAPHNGDGPALLRLVGTLQQQGMTLQGLSWRLSPEASRKAQHEATARALSRLRARAEEAATLLGLRFLSFREVRLDANPPSPRPLPMFAMARAAPAAPPPVAQSEDITVEASVGADAILGPVKP